MSLFRRKESLHERLAREGGLVEPEREPPAPWREVGVHGMQRPREWDATQTVEAPGIEGDAATFVVLPDGSVLVEEGSDSELQPLADRRRNVAGAFAARPAYGEIVLVDDVYTSGATASAAAAALRAAGAENVDVVTFARAIRTGGLR